ncbi:hypothetical protein IW261DRAFT_1424222 [Armillaria novae-zelandiae]|uniref:Uncharacterized protein n=1 Tax=Armillaria novae-zelandiae TaxID=153914 RepID=A0AA39TXC8_9AGAR|nr:hypothetical protein IW261DRAFT_1424222 [Armillaria novae-zelandiae]
METPPPYLSQNDKIVIFNALDTSLNVLFMEGFLQGVYTGMIAVTLWTIVFIFMSIRSPWSQAYYYIDSISGGITTILVDITVIWRCWILWDCQWQVILIPMMCVLAETMSAAYADMFGAYAKVKI